MIDVVIASAARTAIGSFGRSLRDIPPTELGATVAGVAIERAGLEPDQVEQVVFGNVIHTEVVPIEVKTRKGTVEFRVDEHVRRDATLETFTKLKPAFKKDGTVTAGNASGVNDAGAAVVVMSARRA